MTFFRYSKVVVGDKMIDKIHKFINEFNVDYMDIRHEEDRIIRIYFKGKKLENLSDSVTKGFHVRVIADGGFATCTVNDEKELRSAIEQTVRAAKLSAKFNPKKVRFKLSEPVKDEIYLKIDDDPRKISIDEKLEILKKYNDLVLSYEKIQSTSMEYEEWDKKKFFVSSHGTSLYFEEVICQIFGKIYASDGCMVEDIWAYAGGSFSFNKIRNREELFENRTKIAIDLLKADKVPSGKHRVLLNQDMVGVFIHEAFGHFSEADDIKDHPQLLRKFKLGEKIAPNCLTVIDDPTIKGAPGFKIYDDEGIKAKKTYLIKDGILTGRLHSMRTAYELDEELTGNAVAVSWRFTPIVRMSNIFVDKRDKTFTELLDMLGDGLYICDAKGGQTMGDMFSFGAQYGFEVKNGKIGKMYKDINLSGNLFTTLMNIEAVGNDLHFRECGGCGKYMQFNLQSGTGGPHMIIKEVIIG